MYPVCRTGGGKVFRGRPAHDAGGEVFGTVRLPDRGTDKRGDPETERKSEERQRGADTGGTG